MCVLPFCDLFLRTYIRRRLIPYYDSGPLHKHQIYIRPIFHFFDYRAVTSCPLPQVVVHFSWFGSAPASDTCIAVITSCFSSQFFAELFFFASMSYRFLCCRDEYWFDIILGKRHEVANCCGLASSVNGRYILGVLSKVVVRASWCGSVPGSDNIPGSVRFSWSCSAPGSDKMG